MHPAYSVIFFTVASGAGFGLLTLLGFAAWSSATPSTAFLMVNFGIGFALAVAGLLSSTLHLGHPERAWRALSQWRSSWLSREGVLAIAALIVLALFAAIWIFGGSALGPLGLIGAVLAVVTVFATGMIYAQIKAVQRWNRWLTPACYIAFALAGGTLLFTALHAAFFGQAGPFLSSVAMVALLIAFALKMFWWWSGDRLAPRSTPETATGLGRIGSVRLLEAPHSGSNYLLREMGFRVARKHARKLRLIAVGLGLVLPVALILFALPMPGDALWLGLAVISHLAGMLAERWLFFAEAEHAVMNYYM